MHEHTPQGVLALIETSNTANRVQKHRETAVGSRKMSAQVYERQFGHHDHIRCLCMSV